MLCDIPPKDLLTHHFWTMLCCRMQVRKRCVFLPHTWLAFLHLTNGRLIYCTVAFWWRFIGIYLIYDVISLERNIFLGPMVIAFDQRSSIAICVMCEFIAPISVLAFLVNFWQQIVFCRSEKFDDVYRNKPRVHWSRS